MDAILHRLIFQEVPREGEIGDVYFDGLRENALFEKDWLYERDGETFRVPDYTTDPSKTFLALDRWHSGGGSARWNITPTGISAQFHYGAGYWYSGTVTRTKIGWMVHRLLAPAVIDFLRTSQTDDCTWIDGISP